MDASPPSLSGREATAKKDQAQAEQLAQSSNPIGSSQASVPAISVTTMDSSRSPPPTQPVQAHVEHPLAQSPVTPTVAFSQPSPPLDAATSSTSTQDQQPPRSRNRAPHNATSVRQDTPSTTLDAGQAEKQQPNTDNDDTNNRKTNPPSSAISHIRAFLRLVRLDPLPWFLSWIPPNLTWPKLKPVIRSALTAWTLMVIFLIKPAELAIGNASFLVLVASFIQPAEAPLAAVVEREFFTLLFVCIAWAWSVIAIAISYAARNNKVPRAQADLLRAIAGDYIEAGPSVVCAVFLSFGSAVVLYIKIRFGPGPFLFATVFSCILMNICLTYAPLYPFPFYSLGQSVVVPLALKAAVNIFYSIVFFPKSVNSQFVEKIVAVLQPIASACSDQVKLLQTSPLDLPSSGARDVGEAEGFDFELVSNKLAAAEGGLMPLAMASRLLTREISFGLARGDDFKELERLTRALIAPADGWAYYYSSIKADLTSAHFRRTPLPSRLATPAITPAITPRTSAEHSREASESGHAAHTAHLHQLVPPSRPHSPSLSPLSPLTPLPSSAPPAHPTATATATHDTHHTLSTGAVPGSSTPYRESPLHGEVFFNDASQAPKFRQLDEHPSVEPGHELSSSRFRKMARSIAAASRSSSPRRWIHHSHHASTHDVRERDHEGRHLGAWDKSSQMLHNFVYKRDPAPVAIWESIRFGNLETYLHTAASNYVTEMFAQLIRETSAELLTADAEAIRHVTGWLTHLNAQRYHFLRDRLFLTREQQRLKGEAQAQETNKVIEAIEAKLVEFRKEKRLKVLDPYRDALRPHDGNGHGDFAAELDLRTGPGEISKIHHRYLYQAWLHQFHSISFTERLLALLREVEAIQRHRVAAVVWYPHWPRLFSAEAWRNPSADVHNADEPDGDPGHIPDIQDTPVASRQRSRSSQTAVEHESPKCECNVNDTLHDSTNAERGQAHAHFCGAHDHGSDAEATVSDPIMDLGCTRARDPDALDPEGFLQVVGNTVYFWVHRPFHGNALFGVKAAALIALVSLPAFMKSSAGWCYENRAIWAIFMAQLTLARFRGETAFALLSRLLATVIGAVWGLVIWYIATGDGRGNAYGLGATTAVAFPLLMMYRIYFPGPPITPIISAVTTVLIVGYSWKDVTAPAPGSPGYGWDTAWRRFVAVAVGVTAAYILSYLPPSSTLREYQRLSHAATIAELGKIYCAVVGIASHAHQQGDDRMHVGAVGRQEQQSRAESRRTSLHHEAPEANANAKTELQPVHVFHPDPSSEVVCKRIIGIRAKLRRLSMISVNVSYEFSLRGRWPAARYKELFETQMQISKLLSHTLAILERLGAAYSIALLRRTRFLDPRFLGDVVSVISMCSTALKTGEPLPQITPCPLVDRFMDTPHGFNAYLPSTQQAGEGAGVHTGLDKLLAELPQKISITTLEDTEYMTFSVGVATLFGLVVRIDKLCVAVKELVGESYAVPADVHRMLSTTK